jgi:hypothetical protein
VGRKGLGAVLLTGVACGLFAASAAAAAASTAVMHAQLITCNMCGCGKYMDAVFTVLAAAWWLAAGFILAAQVCAQADSALAMDLLSFSSVRGVCHVLSSAAGIHLLVASMVIRSGECKGIEVHSCCC